MAINRATYLDDDEDLAVRMIAADRKWSISQTIAELVREAPTFRRTKTNKQNAVCAPAEANDPGG